MTDKTQALNIAVKLSTGKFSHIESPLILDIVTETLAALEQPAVSEEQIESAMSSAYAKSKGLTYHACIRDVIKALRDIGVLTNVIWEDGE